MKKFKGMTNQEIRNYYNSPRYIIPTILQNWAYGLFYIYSAIAIITVILYLVNLNLSVLVGALHMFNPIEHIWIRIVMLILFIPAWMLQKYVQNMMNFFPVTDPDKIRDK